MISSTKTLYAAETARLVAARVPALTAVFVVTFAAAYVPEHLAHPGRSLLYGTIFGIEVLVCLVAVVITRREPGTRHSRMVVTVACVLLCLLIGAYNTLAHGEAEVLALALAYLMTGVTVFLPLGGWGQFPVVAAALCAYLGAVSLGAESVTSIPITTIGLTAIGALTVAGAVSLERYRYDSFHRNEELRQANAALAQANEAKNMFLANVSHELRTPLNVILGYVQLALDGSFGQVPAAVRQPLLRVVASAQTLVYLINDLLDLSRIEAGQLTVNLEPVALAPLFGEVAALIAASVESKPVSVVAEDPGGLTVVADRDRLRQVLVNLLSNAVKFTERGEIRLGASPDPGDARRVRLRVSDTGIGIAPVDLPQIFEPFHRATNAKEFGGVGIGLSISARLTREMGGEISVDSVVDRGSRFSVCLPAAESPAEDGGGQISRSPRLA